MQQTSKGFRKYNPNDVNDQNVDVAQWILDDSSYNMDLANQLITENENETARVEREYKEANNAIKTELKQEVDNKITHGGIPQSNFNFSSREVVQDGLEIFKIDNNDVDLPFTDEFTLQIQWDYFAKDDGYLFSINQYGLLFNPNRDALGYRDSFSTGGIKYLRDTKFHTELSKPNSTLVLTQKNGKLQVFVNGKGFTIPTTVSTTLVARFKGAIDGRYFEGIIKGMLFYNRKLSPQEIQHNFQVLNNSPSIDRLITTDTQGEKKEFLVGTQGSLVTMQNGYNADQFADGVMDMFKQEFVSADGSPINVLNPMQYSKICGLEIKGQTIKNLIGSDFYDGTGIHPGNYEGFPITSIYKIYIIPIDGSKKYKLICKYDKTNPPSGDKYMAYSMYDENKVQVHKTNIMTGGAWVDVNLESPIHNTAKYLVLEFYGYEPQDMWKITVTDTLNQNEIIPSGLSSTQAILNVNDSKYPFLEPQIRGNSWVENGVLKSLMPSDDTLPPLGGVPSISDAIDRATREMSLETRLRTLNGNPNEPWQLNDIQEGSLTISFRVRVSDKVDDNSSGNNLLCGSIAKYDGNLDVPSIIGGATSWGIILRVLKSELTTLDVDGLRVWLQANPTTVRYRLVTPIKRQLTTEELKAYGEHEKVISLHEGDSLQQTITGDASWVKGNVETMNLDFRANPAWDLTTTKFYNIHISNMKAKGRIFCGKLPVRTGADISQVDEVMIMAYHPDKYLGVRIPNEENIVDYLKDELIIYELDNSTTTTIDKRAMPCVPLSSQEINIGAGDGVGASEFKVVAPTTDNIYKKFTLTPINSYTGSAIGHLLNDGNCELVLDVTIPDVFNQTICMLPNELRPTVERKIPCVVGDSAAIITIGTDGSVKVPVQASGKITVKTTYEK